ncbi:unnamed protein product [Ranitomeya imitator]|uniref:MIT domain-containing protein n=1 Tax=Ranitomeya imitator TaxID=111125 RepID=A0ABN9LH67_9NEOB|nr:unnamed protein product [Ranitomeya imitator]
MSITLGIGGPKNFDFKKNAYKTWLGNPGKISSYTPLCQGCRPMLTQTEIHLRKDEMTSYCELSWWIIRNWYTGMRHDLLTVIEKQPLAEMQDNTLIRSIEEEYRKAFVYINKGLNTDETGYKEEARNYYKQGQEHLIRGLSVSLQGPECIGPAWDAARQMQGKMRETLENINTRLNILQQSMSGPPANPPAVGASTPVPTVYPSLPPKEKEKPERVTPLTLPPFPSEPVNGVSYIAQNSGAAMDPHVAGVSAPPAYTPQATDGHYTVSYGTESGEHSIFGDEFYAMPTQPPPVQSLGVDAEELILIPRGVQIFYVTPDGLVSAPSYPGYLRIINFMDTSSEMDPNRPPAFLQVCDWLYPLMSNQSPVLLSNNGVYMFPDLMSQLPGSYVGVVLSAELPAADLELFEDLMKQMSDLRIQPGEASGEVIDLTRTIHVISMPEPEPMPKEEEEQPPWSEKVAQGIRQGKDTGAMTITDT